MMAKMAQDARQTREVYNPWRFCVAPMMGMTHRHCRYFHRLLSAQARLYTPMLTADAVIHGERERLLGYDPVEHPVGLQLGGCEPHTMRAAARIAADLGYDEVNINAGCPSSRVQAGTFGAVLMAQPQRLAHCVIAIREAVSVPVSVKCRIGIDDADPKEMLWRLADAVFDAGADTLIVHARKAWLAGLSPTENRTVPPLDYDLVYGLQRVWPAKNIVINGGITSLAAIRAHGMHMAGVMLGRAACKTPEILLDVDAFVTGSAQPGADRKQDRLIEAIVDYADYAAMQKRRGASSTALLAPLIGCFAGQPGARLWRRLLSGSGADVSNIQNALDRVFITRSGNNL